MNLGVLTGPRTMHLQGNSPHVRDALAFSNTGKGVEQILGQMMTGAFHAKREDIDQAARAAVERPAILLLLSKALGH